MAPRDRLQVVIAGSVVAALETLLALRALAGPLVDVAARPSPLSSGVRADRVPVPGPPVSDEEHEDALALALLLADCDTRWGDYA